MKTINRRVRKLESRFGNERPQRLWVACTVGEELALDHDACIGILGECGYLPTGRFGVVNLCRVPGGLSAEDLESFLRAHGAGTSDFRPTAGWRQPPAN